MDRYQELSRKKDIVCLILSYPPLNSCLISSYPSYLSLSSLIKGRHQSWILDVLEITHKVRQIKATTPSTEKEINISRFSSEISRLLDHSIHDIEAYVPPDMIKEMCKEDLKSRIMPEKEMRNLAINFATRQILEYIGIRQVQRLGISGVDTKIVSRLKHQASIRNMFNIIILVNALNCRTIGEIEDSIARKLGLSTSSTQVGELLKHKNFLILLNDVDFCEEVDKIGTSWWCWGWNQKIVSTYRLHRVNHKWVDLEIRLEDHLLSWELFRRNVGKVLCSSIGIQRQVIHVLKQCCGHLLATVLMARSLKGVNKVHIWEYASHALQLLPPLPTEDRILFNALAFIWGGLGPIDQKSIKYCVSYLEREGTSQVDLILRWIKGGIIETLKGDEIIRNLVKVFLLERFQNGNLLRMRDEIYKELVKLFEAAMDPMLLELGERELREAPVDEAWKEAGRILLMNNKISKLPKNPHCPKLDILF